MKPHPSDLWKDKPQPIAFEMVRARGMLFFHQKRTSDDAALCGLKPAHSIIHGRWTLYGALPKDSPWWPGVRAASCTQGMQRPGRTAFSCRRAPRQRPNRAVLGAPGSPARIEQENLMALEEAARAAIARARGE